MALIGNACAQKRALTSQGDTVRVAERLTCARCRLDAQLARDHAPAETQPVSAKAFQEIARARLIVA